MANSDYILEGGLEITIRPYIKMRTTYKFCGGETEQKTNPRFAADSDNSENEGGGLGNVNRVITRPPTHSGKPKKGHLCFDASFETGNLGKVELVSDFEYDLYIRPDTCNPYHRIWFNFIVDNTKLDQRVMFNIVNISKNQNLFCSGMPPLVKCINKRKWNRMPAHQVYYYRSPNHNRNYVLTLPFSFDKEETGYQFSYCYPYSYSKCQAYLESIEKKEFPFFKRESLGNSIQKRKVDILTITDPSNMQGNKKTRIVLILSRIHPGESPTSFVCQGIVDFLLSDHPVVQHLRNFIVFKIVPMINPDGVVLGNFRSNLLGADLNRTWNRVSLWMHPTLHPLLNVIFKLNQDKNVELDFIMDLHAHCSLCGVFIYGNTYDDVYRHERHTLFPKLLSQNVEGYEKQYCMFNNDNRKRGSARRFLCSNLKSSVNCYSLFVSFYGYRRKKGNKFTFFTEQSYYRVGRNIVRAFYDYYKSIGVINTSGSKQNKTKKVKSRKKKKTLKIVRFSRIKRHLRIRRPHRRIKDEVLREVTSIEVRSKLDLRKGKIDFSNVVFPPIKTNSDKHVFQPTKEQEVRTKLTNWNKITCMAPNVQILNINNLIDKFEK